MKSLEKSKNKTPAEARPGKLIKDAVGNKGDPQLPNGARSPWIASEDVLSPQ